MLLLFSLNCRVQIGVRLVFPLVASLLVALAVGLGPGDRGLVAIGRGALSSVVLTAACSVPAATAWPDGMRYANELWGGPETAAPILADSNYDWGQGLKDLDRWTAEHGLPDTQVWYYGMDPVIGNDKARLTAAARQGRVAGSRRPPTLANHVRGKVVAVGRRLLYGYPGLTPTDAAWS